MALPNNAKISDIITALQDMHMLNGKSEITNVLGSPFTNTDNPIQIVNKIQSIKNTMATNLTNKGVNSVGTETLNGLVNKIGNIKIVTNEKRWASGTTTPTFDYPSYSIRVTNLAFNPTIVIAMASNRTIPYEKYSIYAKYGSITRNTIDACYDANGIYKSNTALSTPNKGFSLIVNENINYNWIAIE